MTNITVKAKKPALDVISMLMNNIEIIMKNKQIVLNNPDFYNICIDGISIGSAYTGEVYIPLGVLLRLWDGNIWHTGMRYTYHIGGSPLSGLCFEQCWDSETKSFCQHQDRNFITLARPAFNMINKEKDKSITSAIHIPRDKKLVQTARLQDVLECIAANKSR